jgi:predicted PurR-regulated permease PerM
MGTGDLGGYARVSMPTGATRKPTLDTVVTQTEDTALHVPASAEAERVLLHMPVDVRSAALAVLAVLAVLYTLAWAKAVCIPILLGLMGSYALTPIVDRLERWRLPRVVAAALLLGAIVSALSWTAWSLAPDATAVLESLPTAAQRIRAVLQRAPGGDRPKPAAAIEKVQQAASELEKAAEASAASAASAAAQARGVTRVQIEKPRFNVQDYFWTGTLGLIGFIGQAAVVLFLTFFLLASGNTFRRKLVKIAGPTFAEKKLTIQALDEITDQIQRYLLVQVLTSLFVAIATWLVFLWIGIEHAAVWGLVGGVLNFVPYIGSILFTVVSAVVALLQFGTLESALLVAAASLALHTFTGYVITPWLSSRAGRMNAVTVFVGVLAWGWLWGLWGLLLGVPILMVVKAVCDRVDDLKPLGELLGS